MAKINQLTYESRVRNLFIKIYYEQLFTPAQRKYYIDLQQDIADGHANYRAIQTVEEMQKIALANFKNRIIQSSAEYFIMSMLHDKDTMKSKDNLEKIIHKKDHFHISVWRLNDNAFRIRTITDMLKIMFDPTKDYDLWQEHGVETFKKSHRPNIAMYFTHETAQSELDGKFPYQLDELMTNQPMDKVKKIRDKYSSYEKHVRLTDAQWDQASEEAYKLGYDAGNFDKWADEHFTARQRSSSIFNKDVIKHYANGLNNRLSKDDFQIRASILIWGNQNVGKTYTTSKTLVALGENIYKASTGSGKYDGLTADKTAMTFDDRGVKDTLAVLDDKIVALYRRNNGFAPWAGHYAVVTTNFLPWTWMGKTMHLPYNNQEKFQEDMHYIDKSDQLRYKAIRSRLYICHIENGYLVCDSVQERGADIESTRREHDKLFLKFAEKFDEILQDYYVYTGMINAGIYEGNEKTAEADLMMRRFSDLVGRQKAQRFMSTELKDALSDQNGIIKPTKYIKELGLEVL